MKPSKKTKTWSEHGLSGKKEYHIWTTLRGRCNNPHDKRFQNYGGRGITCSQEWDSFKTFYEDMGPRPSAQYSIDRIDNDGGYSKENCRWATREEQNNNRRYCRHVFHLGQTKTESQWARLYGIKVTTLRMRLRRGVPIEKALTMKNYASRQTSNKKSKE